MGRDNPKIVGQILILGTDCRPTDPPDESPDRFAAQDLARLRELEARITRLEEELGALQALQEEVSRVLRLRWGDGNDYGTDEFTITDSDDDLH